MANELKLCPFCGKKPMVGKGGPGNLVWYIECEEDEHVASVQSGGTRKEAIAAWNTRPFEDALVEALKAVRDDEGLAEVIASVGEGIPPFMHKVLDALKKAGRLN